jgi:hypothetical protein
MRPGDRAIQTRYAGCRFRSRLEARWAVFFDAMGIPWQYESQGYYIGGRTYLPDFYLTECATWVEVKGDEGELDHSLMLAGAERLPAGRPKGERGPRLLILGPIPEAPSQGDLGWIGIDVARTAHGEVGDGDRMFGCAAYFGELEPRYGRWECACGFTYADDEAPHARFDFCSHLSALFYGEAQNATSEVIVQDQWWGFGRYHEARCPHALANTSCATPVADGAGGWLEPALDPYEGVPPALAAAYIAARSARFEHGERRRSR